VAGRFRYRAADGVSGLVEAELDHVVVARLGDEPVAAPAEVSAHRWIGDEALDRELRDGRLAVTPWFAPALAIARQHGGGLADTAGSAR
jgi:isopentenyldiphosphate isomerase